MYINCTTLKLVMHVTTTVWREIIQAAALYTYNKAKYWLFKLSAWAWTFTLSVWNLPNVTITSCRVSFHTLSMCTKCRVCCRVASNQRSAMYINCTILKLVVHSTNKVWSVLFQAALLYTYNKVRYWLFILSAWVWTFTSVSETFRTWH